MVASRASSATIRQVARGFSCFRAAGRSKPAPPAVVTRSTLLSRRYLSNSMAPVTHVLFDMDGLLLDTESFYTIVQQEIVGEYGKTFTWDLKSRMMGKKALEAGQILVDELDLSAHMTAEEFVKRREERLDELFPTSKLLPGVERLVRHLHSQGVGIAIATSSHRRHFELKTTLHGELFKLFDHVVTGDLVKNGKPDPEIFLTCMEGFKDTALAPASCLVFEDAPTGVTAGKRAGMQVVMIPDKQLDPEKCKEADLVISSMELFKPEDFGLPPFPEAQ